MRGIVTATGSRGSGWHVDEEDGSPTERLDENAAEDAIPAHHYRR